MKKARNYKHERALAKKRGETGVGSSSGDATRHRARRKLQKKMGRKLAPSEVVDHKKPIKSGGGNGVSNLRIRKLGDNAAHGGKIGNPKGKGKKKKA